MTDTHEAVCQRLVHRALSGYINITRWLMRDALRRFDGLSPAEKSSIIDQEGEGYLGEARWLASRGKRLLRVMEAAIERIPSPINEAGTAALKQISVDADKSLNILLGILNTSEKAKLLDGEADDA